MIFYFNATGEPLSFAPERIMQGSNNVSVIYFVCPISPASVVTANFLLPDGSRISRLMALVQSEESINTEDFKVSIFKLDVNDAITAQAGLVEVAFSVQCVDSRFNTVLTIFTVEEGLIPETPNAEAIYDDIINYIIDVNNSLINVNNELEKIPQNLSDLTDDIDVAVKNANNAFTTSQSIAGNLDVTGEVSANGKNLSQKQDKLTAGENIIIDSNNVISADIFVPTPTTWGEVKNLIRQGKAKKVLSVADQFEVERTSSVSVNIGESLGITSVKFDPAVTMQKAITYSEDLITLTYTENAWFDEKNNIQSLSEWGLTITGTEIDGDQIVILKTTKNLIFDVLGFNQCIPQEEGLSNSMVLGMHDVYSVDYYQFNQAQLMYYTENGLPAGKYKFSLDHAGYGGVAGYEGTYMFELSSPIPAGGGFRHRLLGYYTTTFLQTTVLGNKIITYNPVTETQTGEIIENGVLVSLYDGSEATDLGTFTANRKYYQEEDLVNIGGRRNSIEKQLYGSNRWKTSAIRQWLNSSAEPVAEGSNKVSNWWTPQSVFDRVPNQAKASGFLYGIEADFINSIKQVEVKTALTNFDRTSSQDYDICYDKIFLQSSTNVFGTLNNNIAEGEQFEYWVGASDTDRIKYKNNVNRPWKLRSASPAAAYLFNSVSLEGKTYTGYADAAYGIVPTCCII